MIYILFLDTCFFCIGPIVLKFLIREITYIVRIWYQGTFKTFG